MGKPRNKLAKWIFLSTVHETPNRALLKKYWVRQQTIFK